MKYKRQTDNSSCGPVAIYNCLLDDNRKVAFKLHKEVMLEPKESKRRGTSAFQFHHIASVLGYTLKRSKRINNKYRYFAIYKTHKGPYHFIYINKGLVVNAFKDKLTTKLTKTYLEYMRHAECIIWKIT